MSTKPMYTASDLIVSGEEYAPAEAFWVCLWSAPGDKISTEMVITHWADVHSYPCGPSFGDTFVYPPAINPSLTVADSPMIRERWWGGEGIEVPPWVANPLGVMFGIYLGKLYPKWILPSVLYQPRFDDAEGDEVPTWHDLAPAAMTIQMQGVTP